MSDQNTPPPFDENSPAQDAPPPIAETPPPVGPAPGTSSASGLAGLTAAPPTEGISLGMGKMQESDEKTMGMLAHLLGAITCLLGPLIIWLIKKDESPFVNDQGKEAVNFQLSIFIGYVVTWFLMAILSFASCVIGLLLPALWIAGVVFGILGCVEANKGVVYRYPYSLRFIK